MIETSYFKINAGRYVRAQMLTWAERWWWALALPFVALIVAGSWDMRYYFAAIGLLLVLYPGVMIIVYYNYALTPQAAMDVLEHKISVHPHSITTHYRKSTEQRTPGPRTTPLSQVRAIEDTGDALRLYLKDDKYTYIEIPQWAFRPGDMEKCITMLQSRI